MVEVSKSCSSYQFSEKQFEECSEWPHQRKSSSYLQVWSAGCVSPGDNTDASCCLSFGDSQEDFGERGESQVLLKGGGQEGTRKAAEVTVALGWTEAEDKSGLH